MKRLMWRTSQVKTETERGGGDKDMKRRQKSERKGITGKDEKTQERSEKDRKCKTDGKDNNHTINGEGMKERMKG